jgi:hypothetical protein
LQLIFTAAAADATTAANDAIDSRRVDAVEITAVATALDAKCSASLILNSS